MIIWPIICRPIWYFFQSWVFFMYCPLVRISSTPSQDIVFWKCTWSICDWRQRRWHNLVGITRNCLRILIPVFNGNCNPRFRRNRLLESLHCQSLKRMNERTIESTGPFLTSTNIRFRGLLPVKKYPSLHWWCGNTILQVTLKIILCWSLFYILNCFRHPTQKVS